MKSIAVNVIKANGYSHVDIYFDNDSKGKKTLAYFWKTLPVPEITILNKNHLCELHKDFNAFLVSKLAQQLNREKGRKNLLHNCKT